MRTSTLCRRSNPAGSSTDNGEYSLRGLEMRGGIDFSSWHTMLSTMLGLGIITLVMVGIRLVVMQTVQRRRERQNRQINERLRTLIAAYKTLGGSFTGNLAVDPTHLGELRRRSGGAASPEDQSDGPMNASPSPSSSSSPLTSDAADPPGAERRRRIRDAVEAALSDVILLGTEEQVQLAVQAANDLTAGRPVETAEIVISLRTFIREVLDLDAVPPTLLIPRQGPVRPSSNASRGAGRGDSGNGRGGSGAGGGMGGGAATGGGAAMGGGASMGVAVGADDPPHH